MDVQSPHNIMLRQVSADEYETALQQITPVAVADFGFLAGMRTPPPTDELGRNVYWLYVHIGNNHFRSVYRMPLEEFKNIRVWQFTRDEPTPRNSNVVAAKRKRAS
jgi:hypothetical protein